MLRGGLVIAPEGESRILALSFEWFEPKFAAEAVNAVAEVYKKEVMESRWQASQQTSEYLEKKLQDLKKDLQRSETALQHYANETGLMYTNDNQSVAEERLRQVQADWSEAQASRVARQSQYETAKSGSIDTLPEILDDGILRQYQGRLTDLRRELAQLETRFKPTYPKVQELHAQIAELEAAVRRDSAKVIERVRNEYESALRRERLLAADYRSQAAVVTEQAGKAIQYKMLAQEVDSNRQLYDSMLQKLREAGIASAMKTSNVRILDPAEPPLTPYSPKVKLTMLGGMFVGLCLGVLVAFARDSMDGSVRMPGDASRLLHLAELGVIPRRDSVPCHPGQESLLHSWRRSLSGAVNEEKLGNYRKHWSPLAEYFRVTLTSILFAHPRGKTPKLLVVTSPGPGEGKSSVASNLAITLAEIGKRVLLVDADMRRPRLHEIFSLPNTWGLSDLLKGEGPVENYPLEAIARSTGISGLHVLTSGQGSGSIARLLYSTCGKRLLERLREEFDTVIIDTPPMLQISDARVIGRLADGVILVLRSGQTSRESAKAAKERLQADGIPVLGSVLNGWNPKTYGYGSYDNYDAYNRYYDNVNNGRWQS
jgi:capsular exopolysaccharide synthesis family protein